MPLHDLNNADLGQRLASLTTGEGLEYFSFYIGMHAIDDFTGMYVTVTAMADGSFKGWSGNHGRSGTIEFSTIEKLIADIETGRTCDEAFLTRRPATS